MFSALLGLGNISDFNDDFGYHKNKIIEGKRLLRNMSWHVGK